MNTVTQHDIWQLAGLNRPLVLASSSPRRAAILKAVSCPFEVVIPSTEEESYKFWDGGELLKLRAVQKAESVSKEYSSRVVLAADTVVRIGDNILGKPRDADEAHAFLTVLSGKSHEVLTALCLIWENNRTRRIGICRTEVAFKRLSSEIITTYVESGEPLDKAGAYGIQGIGGLWIESIRGCYFNVVGLPISMLWDYLMDIKGDS